MCEGEGPGLRCGQGWAVYSDTEPEHQAPRSLGPDPSLDSYHLYPQTFTLQSPHLGWGPCIRWVQPMEATGPRDAWEAPQPHPRPLCSPPLPLCPAHSLKKSPAKNPCVRLC